MQVSDNDEELIKIHQELNHLVGFNFLFFIYFICIHSYPIHTKKTDLNIKIIH